MALTKNHDSYQDKLEVFQVLCYTRPNLRCEALEYEMYFGRGVLNDMFDEMKMRPDVTKLVLSFPERWLNIIEQRQLYSRLEKYCPNLKELQIKTHSVYIIQCTQSKNIGVVDDPTKIPEHSSLDNKLYIENVGNYINTKGLNIL